MIGVCANNCSVEKGLSKSAILGIIPQGKPTPSELNPPTTVARDFPNTDTLQALW